MGQRGAASRVHAHDEQRDEDHSQAGEEEQAAPRPFVGQGGQDLGGDGAGGSEVQILLKDFSDCSVASLISKTTNPLDLAESSIHHIQKK